MPTACNQLGRPLWLALFSLHPAWWHIHGCRRFIPYHFEGTVSTSSQWWNLEVSFVSKYLSICWLLFTPKLGVDEQQHTLLGKLKFIIRSLSMTMTMIEQWIWWYARNLIWLLGDKIHSMISREFVWLLTQDFRADLDQYSKIAGRHYSVMYAYDEAQKAFWIEITTSSNSSFCSCLDRIEKQRTGCDTTSAAYESVFFDTTSIVFVSKSNAKSARTFLTCNLIALQSLHIWFQ